MTPTHHAPLERAVEILQHAIDCKDWRLVQVGFGIVQNIAANEPILKAIKFPQERPWKVGKAGAV